MSDHLADQFGMHDGEQGTEATESAADASSMYDEGGSSAYGMDGMYDDAQPGNDDAADDTSTSDTTTSASSTSDSHATDSSTSQSGSGGNVTMTYEGTSYDAGEATYDADGDGQADTAVQDHGYQVEYYVDSDGDGQADELTITDADGNLISHTENVEGTDTWEETPAPDTSAGDISSQSGNSSSSSAGDSNSDKDSSSGGDSNSDKDSSSAEEAPQADSAGSASEDDLGTETAAPESSSVSGDSSGDSEVASIPMPPDAPSLDTSSSDTSASDTSGSESGQLSPPGEAGEAEPGDMTIVVDGQPYDIGEPTHDITGDGTPDTVAIEKDGTVEYYVDTDQDGVVDQIVVLDESDGSLINHEVYDAESGTWNNVTEESAQTGG